MTWPNSIPPDLRRRLEDVLSYRSFGPADLWGEIRDWLIKHQVAAPDQLPEDLRPSGPNEIRPREIDDL
jgi:hypothetical protein